MKAIDTIVTEVHDKILTGRQCETLLALQGQGKCCTGGSGTPGCMAPLDCCKFRNTGCTVPPPQLAPAPAPLVAPLLIAPAPAPIIIETPAPAPIVIETPAPAPIITETPAPAPFVYEPPAPAPVPIEPLASPAAVKDVFLTRKRVVTTAARVPVPAPAPAPT